MALETAGLESWDRCSGFRRSPVEEDGRYFHRLQSLITYSDLRPDSSASSGYFKLCGPSVADTADFQGSIVKETYHKNNCIAVETSGGCDWPLVPVLTGLTADLIEGTVLLRWDQAQAVSTSSSTERGPRGISGSWP